MVSCDLVWEHLVYGNYEIPKSLCCNDLGIDDFYVVQVTKGLRVP